MSFGQYMILCSVGFLLAGIKWYIIDRAFFCQVYRKLYNWTHRHRLPDNVERGFIYGQTTKTRFWWAIVMDTIISTWIVWAGAQNIFIEMIMWVWQIPMLMLGFILGKQVWKLWSKKDEYFDKVDKIESGETQIGKEIADRSRAAITSSQEFVKKIVPRKSQEKEPEVIEVKPSTPQMSEKDARAAIDKFTKG